MVKCTFCQKEIECSEELQKEFSKYMCLACFDEKQDSLTEEDFNQIFIEEEESEQMAEGMTEDLVEEFFEEIWSEKKEEFENLSPKALAQEMFAQGSFIAIRSMLDLEKEK